MRSALWARRGENGSGELRASEARRHDFDDSVEEAEMVSPKDSPDPKTDDDDAAFVCIPPVQVGSLHLGHSCSFHSQRLFKRELEGFLKQLKGLLNRFYHCMCSYRLVESGERKVDEGGVLIRGESGIEFQSER